MRLSELKTGEKGVIVKVLGHGGFRKRIVEMGFIKGKTVEVLLNAPLKDPIKYKVLGYEISLRRQEAEMIEVISEEEAKELAEKICQRVDNHSSYVQQLAWLVWIHTDKTATEQDFEAAYQDIIDQNTPLFEKQTESLTTYQMNFLRAVIDGVHSEFTTQEVLQKYQLGSSANVSIIKRALVKKELIEIEKRQVVIPDPVMKVWLKKELGI